MESILQEPAGWCNFPPAAVGCDSVNRLLRIFHLEDSPRRVALSFALGAFVAFSPLFGVQMALAVVLAVVLRLNRRAALAGTFLNLPWLAPAYYVSALAIGAQIIGLDVTPHVLSAMKAGASALVGAVLELNGVLVRAYWYGLVHQPAVQQSVLALFVGCTILGTAIAASTYKVSSLVLVRRSLQSPRVD